VTRRVFPDEVNVHSQHVPDDFADLLIELYLKGRRTGQLDLLDCVLTEANRKGWTLTALAEPLGLTRERIRQRVARSTAGFGPHELPAIPDPPRRPPPPPPRPRPSEGMADWLRDMYATARTVNGATRLDDPRRGVGEAFSAVLADLIDRVGYSGADVARAANIKTQTMWFRLRRHGYRHNAPSQKPYRRMVIPVIARKVMVDPPPPGERYQAWLQEQRVSM
jgi:hypothetical protein